MPLWLVIMIAGATGCGFLFLKAREIEKATPYKKVKQGNLTVRKMAAMVAKRPSTAPVYVVDNNIGPVEMSVSRVAVAAQARSSQGALPGGLTLEEWRSLYSSIPTFEEYKVEHPEYRGTRTLYYGSHGIKGG